MAAPFNIPDELVQGFLKAGHSFWNQAMQAPDPAPDAGQDANNKALLQAPMQYWQQQLALWMNGAAQAAGHCPESVVAPERGDRRFHDPQWHDNAWYSLLKQSYRSSG